MENSGTTIAGAGREGFPARPGGKFLAAVLAGVLALLIALGYQYLKLSSALERQFERRQYSGKVDFYVAGVCYRRTARRPFILRAVAGTTALQPHTEAGPLISGPALRFHQHNMAN